MTRLPLTDFAAHRHEQLVQMLAAGSVTSVRDAADSWRRVNRSMVELSDAVQAELLAFSPMWQGGAADQYKIMMIEFLEDVDTSAELVASVRDLTYTAADSLQRAQLEMPAAVSVPTLSAVAGVIAEGPSTSANAMWGQLTDDEQGAVADELRRHSRATEVAGSAHSRAVAIMNELAVHYLDVVDAMPALPGAAEAPLVPTDSAAAAAIEASLATTGAPLPLNATSPLFGGMYAAGSLAACAAVLGRFRFGTNWLEQRRQDKADGVPLGGTDAAAASEVLPVGDGGASMPSGGGGGGSVIGGSLPDTPVAHPVLSGGGGGGSGATAAPGLMSPGSVSVTGGGAPTGTGTGMGMMPPMVPPMGGGGEGAGMARRIPPWLVETEPVFGEAVAVTPTVIGGEPDDPRARRLLA